MERAHLVDLCRELPIFPLPRTVLMPGADLPLHVFEPRYRALVAHVLEHDEVLGVATLQPGYESDYQGAPPIHPEVGLGMVVGHQPFPDGRSNIVLQYVGHMCVERELESPHPFRLVQGALCTDDDAGLRQAVNRLRMLVLQLGGLSRDAAEEARRLVELEGMQMVDSLARKLLQDPDDQRAYLATERLAGRVEQVENRLAAFLAASDPVARA